MHLSQSSCYKAATTKALEDAIVALGLEKMGDRVFMKGTHVANVHMGKFIFFLEKSCCHDYLVSKAREIPQLESF